MWLIKLVWRRKCATWSDYHIGKDNIAEIS